MRIAVCDDQDIYRNDIVMKCQCFLSSTEISYDCFCSGEDFLSSEEQYDLLFLDIEMGGVDGILVKDRLAQQKAETKIVFLTSHKERMKEAFGVNVIGFLEKPVQMEELEGILQKLELYTKKEMIEWTEAGKSFAVFAEDIRYIEAQDKYTMVVTNQEQYLVRRSMKEWEEVLPKVDFCRVNRFYLVSMKLMKRTICEVELGEGKVIKISRSRRKDVEEQYMKYLRKQMEKV